MRSASGFTYISSRKAGILKNSKGVAKPIKEENFDSESDASEEELNDFLKAPAAPSAEKKAPAKPKPKPKGAEESKKKYKEEVDTNIVEIALDTLEHPGALATGEPYFCASCGAVLNLFSKGRITKDATSGKSVWICEFCHSKNDLIIDDEEIPKVDTETYLVDKVVQPVAASEPMTDVKDDDITVIFCIDVSGSMDAAKYVKDGKPLKYVKSKNYPTRLEGVKVAIDNQIEKMTQENPRRKIGFVTFENKVTLIGDGTQPSVTFEGDKLNADFFTLLEEVVNYSSSYMKESIDKTNPKLLERLKAIRTGGSTALGPGLIAALGLAAQGSPGSKVILCTDGLANKGIGAVEGVSTKTAASVKEFYTQAAEYAKQHGVIVSLITLVESECRLDMISPVANLTGGDILRVDPMNLSSDFSAFLSDKVIATEVNVKVKIHKGLKFRNQAEKDLSPDLTTLSRDVGNVTRDTVVTFEYCMKSPAEMEKMEDVDWEKLETLPFQSQITYKSMDGKKCLRVISKIQKVTHEKEEAKAASNAEVIGVHAAISAAQMAEKGDYRRAQAKAVMFSKWSNEPKDKSKVKNQVAGIYQALEEQQEMEMPQQDKLTVAMNRAFRNKK